MKGLERQEDYNFMGNLIGTREPDQKEIFNKEWDVGPGIIKLESKTQLM